MTSAGASVPVPSETLIRIDVPLATFEPAAGLCATTVPSGWAEGTRKTRGVSSAAWRRIEPASSTARPTTFGTSTFAVPFETLIRTDEPIGARSSARGSCATTTPGGRWEKTSTLRTSKPASRRRSSARSAGRPPTSVTSAVAGPLETSNVTVEPSGSSRPAPGRWAKTIPAGASSLRLRSILASNPSWSSRWTASPSGRRTTPGTG